MRIVTWNVNGLRAAMGKGFMEWVESEQPEVLCLQEVRARPEQLEDEHLERLEALYPSITWHPAQRPGYSGVAVFSRQKPIEINVGLGASIYDSEGRVIIARYPNFLLFNIYFPNGGHDLSRVPFKLDFYAYLLNMCDRLHAQGEQIVITGDFNTAHREIDLKNPKENANISGFLPEERAWIDRYLESGFIDAYRQLYPERVGYTWWTYRMNARKNGVGWRLDYYLISQAMMGLVRDVVIEDHVHGSDHCPVSLIVEDGISV
jgi:exodeoxyribonuclease-3